MGGGDIFWFKQRSLMRLGGDFKRGNGFQAGLDTLLLSAVFGESGGGVLLMVSNVLARCLRSLAALRALHRGRADVGGGGRWGVWRLQPPDGDDWEQRADLLLGVEREVAEDVLVKRSGGSRRRRGQAAPLILKQHQCQH